MGNRGYDIFISYQSEDYKLAKKVYDFLSKKGLNIFFSNITQKERGEDRWKDKIDSAISNSKICIAVASKKENMLSEWPHAERNRFLGLQLKDNSIAIYSYIAPPMQIDDLPDDIRFHETFLDEQENELDRLFEFIKNRLYPDISSNIFFTFRDLIKSNNQIVVLYSQKYTDTAQTYRAIKAQLQKESDIFYHIYIPMVETKIEYFKSVAKRCNIDSDSIKEPQDFEDRLRDKLDEYIDKRVTLYITDIDEGESEYNKILAFMVRRVTKDYENLKVVFTGGKKLAQLVYENGKLSPLNSVEKLFIPDSSITLTPKDIKENLQDIAKVNKKALCRWLSRDNLGSSDIWSADMVLNELFWRNLIKDIDGKFVWRDDNIASIGRELLNCKEVL